MKLDQINYAPLRAMKGVQARAIRDTFKVPTTTFHIILGVLGLISLFFFSLIGPLLAFAIIIAIVGPRVARYKNETWKNFAAVNGWQTLLPTLVDQRFIPPGLLGKGRKQQLGDIVHAQFEGHECDLYLYQFTTGSGKSSETHYYTVARVLLGRPFPHLILDSKLSYSIQDHGNAKERARLEGNFDKYFSLYYNKDEHIDALSIITPDVMQTLIHSNQAQDIEIIDNYIFFIIHTDQRTIEKLPGILKSVDDLSDEIAHKAKTIQYTSPDGIIPNIGQHAAINARYFKNSAEIANSIGWALWRFFVPFFLVLLFGFVISIINAN